MNSPDERLRFKTASGIPIRLDPEMVRPRESYPGNSPITRHRDLRLLGDTHSHSRWSRPPEFASSWDRTVPAVAVNRPLPQIAPAMPPDRNMYGERSRRMTIGALFLAFFAVLTAVTLAWGHRLLG